MPPSGPSPLEPKTSRDAQRFAVWRRLSRQEWAGGWVTTTALNVLRRRFREAARSLTPGDDRASHDMLGRVDLLRALRSPCPSGNVRPPSFSISPILPLRAVADTMGISDGAIKSHLARAREGLRVNLEERDA